MKTYHDEIHEYIEFMNDSDSTREDDYMENKEISDISDLIEVLECVRKNYGNVPVSCVEDMAVEELYGIHVYEHKGKVSVGIKL